MTQNSKPSLQALTDLIQTIHRLRAPNGCPWDRAQTHQSLRQYLIEEAYEVLDVLDQIKTVEDLKVEKIKKDFREELGDLLMQVLLHSEMTNEVGVFNIYDVAQALNDKLIRRHPHVFGEAQADSADNALQNWEKEKAKEKASNPNSSILDGVPRGLPALQRAGRVLEKVTKVGFQWDDMNGPLEKVEEELRELKVEVLALEKAATKDPEHPLRKKVESELGDLFFTLCNVAYLMKISPEDSLRGTMRRFESRFRHVEKRLKENGKTPEQSDLAEMDEFWNEAKKLEQVQIWGITGGIASGKTTAGRIFSELGIPVIDADQIAKELSEKNGAAYSQILEKFGTTDRSRLREMIFSDPQAKQDLEKILHPLIQAESSKRIRELAQKHSVILYEATLLIETGRYKDLSGLIVVEASKDLRLERLSSRDKKDSQVAQTIIDAQMSDEERKPYANFILKNSGDLEALRSQILGFVSQKGWQKRK